MAAGGYRKPEMPAAVSGPGKYARRTDGSISQPIRDITGGAYGEGVQLHDLQAAAPMSASGRTPQAAPAPMPMGGASPHAVPFTAPTNMPSEPVTAGAAAGPGPGPEALPQQPGPDLQQLIALLPVISHIANGPNGTPDLRNLVRVLKAQAAP